MAGAGAAVCLAQNAPRGTNSLLNCLFRSNDMELPFEMVSAGAIMSVPALLIALRALTPSFIR